MATVPTDPLGSHGHLSRPGLTRLSISDGSPTVFADFLVPATSRPAAPPPPVAPPKEHDSTRSSERVSPTTNGPHSAAPPRAQDQHERSPTSEDSNAVRPDEQRDSVDNPPAEPTNDGPLAPVGRSDKKLEEDSDENSEEESPDSEGELDEWAVAVVDERPTNGQVERVTAGHAAIDSATTVEISQDAAPEDADRVILAQSKSQSKAVGKGAAEPLVGTSTESPLAPDESPSIGAAGKESDVTAPGDVSALPEETMAAGRGPSVQEVVGHVLPGLPEQRRGPHQADTSELAVEVDGSTKDHPITALSDGTTAGGTMKVADRQERNLRIKSRSEVADDRRDRSEKGRVATDDGASRVENAVAKLVEPFDRRPLDSPSVGGPSVAAPSVGSSATSVQADGGVVATEGPARATRRAPENVPARGGERAAEGSSLSRADHQRFLHRVSRAFEMARHRDGEIHLRLSPPELGSLRLELRVEQGAVYARLEAETQAARQLLVDNLPALRDRLEEQGIRIEKFDVELMDRRDHAASHGGEDQRSDDAPHRRQAAPTRNTTIEPGPTEPATARPQTIRDQSINVVI